MYESCAVHKMKSIIWFHFSTGSFEKGLTKEIGAFCYEDMTHALLLLYSILHHSFQS